MADMVRRRSFGCVLPLGRHASTHGSKLIHCASDTIALSSFQKEQNARHHKQFKGEQALVLRLQRPEETSRPSSKPPSTDRKEQRERAKPGGAKPGHEGHSRMIRETPDAVVEHRPDLCPCCRSEE